MSYDLDTTAREMCGCGPCLAWLPGCLANKYWANLKALVEFRSAVWQEVVDEIKEITCNQGAGCYCCPGEHTMIETLEKRIKETGLGREARPVAPTGLKADRHNKGFPR